MGSSKATNQRSNSIASLVRYAVLAPSSHNTQPWRFEVADTSLRLYADRMRSLPANDPDDRELTISCGCALMNLRVAAARAGLRPSCRILPNAADADLLAMVDLNGAPPAASPEAGLFWCLEKRRTYRQQFESRPVPSAALDDLARCAAQEGAWFHVIDAEEDRRRAAALVAEGDALQWSNRQWRRELAAWMRPRRRGDGLTVNGVLAPLVKLIIRTFDMGSRMAEKDRQLTQEAPVVTALGTQGDEAADWVRAGQALQRVLLLGHSKGLQGSFLNQPVQVASLRSRLRRLLKRAGSPQILLRLGFPRGKLPPTPRRALTAVID
ncbi:MAG: nitroreductase family protein [Desulfobacterales bacterium]